MAKKPNPLPPKPVRSRKTPGTVTGKTAKGEPRLPIPADSPRKRLEKELAKEIPDVRVAAKKSMLPIYPGDPFTDPDYDVSSIVMLPNGKAKPGRKLTPPLDWTAIGRMFEFGSTNTEVTAVLRLDIGTISRAYVRDHRNNPKATSFAGFREACISNGKQRLRKAMFGKAIDQDDFAAQKWLSQHYLGMDNASNKIEIDAGKEGGVKITFSSIKLPRDSGNDNDNGKDEA